MNGVFTRVQYTVGLGAFVDHVNQLNNLITTLGPHPPVEWDRVITVS